MKRTLFVRLLEDTVVRGRNRARFRRVTLATIPCTRAYAGCHRTLWVQLPGKTKCILFATLTETKGWRPARLRDLPRPFRWYVTPRAATLLRFSTTKAFHAWEVV